MITVNCTFTAKILDNIDYCFWYGIVDKPESKEQLSAYIKEHGYEDYDEFLRLTKRGLDRALNNLKFDKENPIVSGSTEVKYTHALNVFRDFLVMLFGEELEGVSKDVL